MSAWWMFMVVVGCRLSQATQSQSTCACNSQLKTVCVPAGDNVPVPCPELPGEQLKFNLLRDGEIIYNHTCSLGENALNCEPPFTMGLELHVNTENKSVSFMLTGVNASSHGVYRCKGTVWFPPPLVEASSNLILVLVEGHQCNKVCKSNTTAGDQNCGFNFIWIIVPVSIYSIIITIIAIVIWVKLRRTDSQNDYMNTKPKPPREGRKKRGLQNPIPRYF